ncbi:hypothetical protein SAMN05660653_02643 [Desulfonatronum thiosulfatophilum]|uniref:Uncharacterized protein n=1 Tax=Desulfonatronum thiosulfatophilum TaxID=617002 RepID=A0A1G6E8X8_9BACT|nr:hypothetical protein SAMN05660653_02643 [Desulfonatronum thiosulfatophilum]
MILFHISTNNFKMLKYFYVNGTGIDILGLCSIKDLTFRDFKLVKEYQISQFMNFKEEP